MNIRKWLIHQSSLTFHFRKNSIPSVLCFWIPNEKSKTKLDSYIMQTSLVRLAQIFKPWISLVPYEQAVSSPSSTNHTTATVFISTRFLCYPHLKILQFRRDWNEPTVQCEHGYASVSCHSFQVQAVWCQVINLHHTTPTSGRPHQMQRPLSHEQKRDWINYLITYCQPVMNFTWGKDKKYENKNTNVGFDRSVL